MNGNETWKELRGVKTKRNIFVYNYVLRKFFFTSQVVSHLWRKICFQKVKVLTLKIMRSIFPKEYLFCKIYHSF